NKNLIDKYDLTALAGASLALTGFPHQSDAEAFWDQLDISYKLHHINKVIIIDHQDCGAYAMMIDANLSKDPGRELQVHTDYLNQAYSSIRNRYCDLEIELYFATLNSAEFQQILPTH
ncbi:carbonic anhydrase, partial [Dolichospermum sp. ST_sed5]|nr:carbonic anhydrase [Dolichospermum sp. ST_sed5]